MSRKSAVASELAGKLANLVSVADSIERKVAAWDTLMSLAGSWQDGSQTAVVLHQDDATFECIVVAGKTRVTARSFEGALAKIRKQQEDDEEL